MFKYEVDVPVLLIFFSRPDKFLKVFNQVKKARPSKLFLYQDGPRNGREDDVINIKKCREIVETVDWECEVYTNYQTINIGCDPSEYNAIKWFFSHINKGIILEDDDVPSSSFFNFCKQLLDKYEFDNRIHMICGMNNLGEFDFNRNSYFFSKFGSIWGWATWKRCVDSWDEKYKYLNDICELKKMKEFLDDDKYYRKVVEISTNHKNTNRAHYESINGCSQYINNRLNIIPTKNMISNIGIGEDTTHSTNNIKKLPYSIQKIFNMDTYEIDFPLIHPNEVEINSKFDLAYKKLMLPNKFVAYSRKIEGFLRKKIYR